MKINYLSLFLGSVLLLFAACTKITSTDIGTGLIPAVDGVNTKDTTISVHVKNAGDSTVTPTLTQSHVVGFINDPLFGTTDARINFQLSLPSSAFKFQSKGDDLMLDSVVLVLSYNGIWGDSLKPLALNVNELDNDNQAFLPDTTAGAYNAYISGYNGTYNNTVVFHASTRLNDVPAVIYPTKLDDSIHVFQDSGNNMIRIPLNRNFGERLLGYDSVEFKNDSAFRVAFKGLQVYADSNYGSNALLKIGLTNTNTKLAIYYNYHPTDSAATVRDTTVQYFIVNGTSAHSNYINRNRSVGQIASYFPPGNPGTPNDDLIFIQAGPGTYATITIDSALANMPNYIVHRAELLMEKDSDVIYGSDTYLTPPNLFLLAKNDTSRFVIPGSDTTTISTADAVFSSSYLANYSDFGGIPNHNTTNHSLYSFNLSRYVQGILTRHNRLYPLVLYAPYNEPFQLVESLPYTTSRGYVTSSPTNTAGCGRVRLYGGNNDLNDSHRMRLHIVYSVPH